MHSLEIQSASKFYGAANVLCDINISIGSGEFLVLVGPSGLVSPHCSVQLPVSRTLPAAG